jgi:hypothetical protein
MRAGPIGAGPPAVDGTGRGPVVCTGGGAAAAGFEEAVGTDGGGLQPVCSESQSLDRPPQLTVAAVSAATATESAPHESALELPDATLRCLHIGMA